MKRILYLLLLVFSSSAFSQNAFPDFINYQAVLRDQSNVVLAAGTSGSISFKIYDDLVTASATYEETHNFTVNSAGIVNLQIGKGAPSGSNTFTGSVNWAGGKVCYEVYLNGNIIGTKQAFATVPYAIFSKNAGNGMPGGLPNQTMYYDGNQNKWIASNNLNHNGSNVGVGIANASTGIKMNVVASAADSVALNANKSNAQGGEQAFRAVTSGNTNSSLPDFNQAITGLTSYGSNSGSGMGIGVSGFGTSSGYAYGVIGIGSVTSNTAYGIGLYGTVYNGSITPNSYAGYFDGRTYIGDTLVHFPVTSPSYYHNKVLTLLPSGKAAWRPVATATVAPTILIPGGIVNVNPVGPSSTYTISAAPPTFSNVGIGTITGTYPSYLLNIPPPTFSTNGIGNIFGSYPNYALNVPAPNLTVLGNSITLTQGTVNVTQTISVLNGLGTTGYLPMYSSASTMSVSNIYRNLNNQIGINTINPKTFFHVFKPAGADTMLLESPNGSSMAYALKNVNNRYAMTLNGSSLKFEENGTDRLVISGGNVGIGFSNPSQKLDVNGYIRVAAGPLAADEGWLIASPSPGISLLRAGGRATTEMRLEQPNAASMTFLTSGIERMRIDASGNVGVGIAAPTEKLSVNGNVLIPAANEYLYAGPKTRYYNMPPSSFVRAGTASGMPVYSTIDAEMYLDGTPSAVIGYFSAPVQLPSTATITGVSAYINDPLNGSNDEVTIFLRFVNNASGVATTIASFGSTGPNVTSGYQIFNTAASHVVDNNTNVYTVGVTMGNNSSIRLRNVKITYTVNRAD